jgi:hypothetical protein
MAPAARRVAVKAARTRRMNFTMFFGSILVKNFDNVGCGGATWNRTRDLIVISDAL